jgi:transcription initiation factor TFIIH subunit 2
MLVSGMPGRKVSSLLVQVLILFAALSTCDPGNIMDAVKAAKEKSVRVSVVGMAAEVHICRAFTHVSGECFSMRG